LFFPTPEALRAWFAAHHATAEQVWVGYHKTGTGRASITWAESVDEALCVGWIDAVRKRLDEHTYAIRFTRRKPTSTWSAVNVRRVAELTAGGRMQPAGLAAFARRSEERSGTYAYEQREEPQLGPDERAVFAADPVAWEYFSGQAPWYRRTATWWVVSAKRPATRARRLAQLVADSHDGRRLAHLDR
jgi:uncharacterized protein YdeI (YjbR/CyaY-like superfamily)